MGDKVHILRVVDHLAVENVKVERAVVEAEADS